MSPVRSRDGSTLITERELILQRWVEHFRSVLNQQAVFDSTVLDEIPQWEQATHMSQPPSVAEVRCAVQQMS